MPRTGPASATARTFDLALIVGTSLACQLGTIGLVPTVAPAAMPGAVAVIGFAFTEVLSGSAG
jgi:hypothetical protein